MPNAAQLTSATGRLTFVDGLRGLAALAVVLHHIGRDFLGIPVLNLFFHGVTVFFVLSGFVICHTLSGKKVGAIDVGSFLLKRSIRLDPPYWVALAVALLFVWVPSKIFGYEAVLPALSDIMLHMVYLQDIMGLQPINIVFWTLCFEVQFYIIFGALLYVRSKFVSANQAPAVTSAIFGMLLIMSLSWPLRLVPTGAPGLFISLWYLFLLGVLTRWASSNDRTAQVCLTLAFVVLTLSSVQLHNATAVIGVGTAVALWAAVAAGRTQLWLSWKWLQGLGLISYSLYLIHDIVGIYVRDTGLHLTRKHLDLASVGVNYFWCGMAICASIVAARLLHIYIEAPSQRLSKRLDLTALGSLVQRQLRGLARFR